MTKVKVLDTKDLKNIYGGNNVSCAVSVASGAATGGAIGAIGGVLTGCVTWGYNKTPQHGWT